jgi:hypothetical protein
MHIIQVDPASRKQVRDFIRLPFELYRDTPQWAPMFASDARAPFDLKRFPFYRHSQAAFFLAMEEDEPLGRIVALHNRLYNQYNHKQAATFYWFECRDDPAAAQGLFEAAFDWSRKRGLNEMIGPKGFTALDGGGVLVEGFEHRAAFSMPYNHAYYSSLIEAAGFTRTGENVSGYLSADMHFPERIHELSQRVQQRRGLHIARYRTRKDLRALVPGFQKLYNGSLGGTLENYPISDEEANALAGQLLLFADPRLVKVVMKGDEPVGFLLAYPNINAALRKTKGRLFPFGWFTLWRELKRSDWVDINGAGLIEEYRGSGGTAILFSEMAKSILETGQFRHAEAVQIAVENDRMQREMTNFGVRFYKKHRSYRRDL